SSAAPLTYSVLATSHMLHTEAPGRRGPRLTLRVVGHRRRLSTVLAAGCSSSREPETDGSAYREVRRTALLTGVAPGTRNNVRCFNVRLELDVRLEMEAERRVAQCDFPTTGIPCWGRRSFVLLERQRSGGDRIRRRHAVWCEEDRGARAAGKRA